VLERLHHVLDERELKTPFGYVHLPEAGTWMLGPIDITPTKYVVFLWLTGLLTLASDPLRTAGTTPPPGLRTALATGGSTGFEREIEHQRVYSVLRAIRGSRGTVIGALEVAQPLSFIEAEKAQVRRRFLLNTVTLLAALTLVTLWLVRRVVGRPMERLVGAAQALGGGNLSHRIQEDPGGGEIAQLAREFNTMAGSLQSAQTAILHQAEEGLTLERRLREAEKLAAIGNLAAGVAHEIAAPLNVISGRAELILKHDTDPATRHRDLRIIIQQINRITTIVRNLLDFARRREPHLQGLELGLVVQGVTEFLETELERGGVELIREDVGPVLIQGDPDLLHQVLVNLLLNALQAMEAENGSHRLTLRVRASGTAAIVEVEDTGPGLLPEVQERLFEPFYTTKARGTCPEQCQRIFTGFGSSDSSRATSTSSFPSIAVRGSPPSMRISTPASAACGPWSPAPTFSPPLRTTCGVPGRPATSRLRSTCSASRAGASPRSARSCLRSCFRRSVCRRRSDRSDERSARVSF
jgi:signal transduction histidine kinase